MNKFGRASDLSVRTEKQYSIFLLQWNTYVYTCLHRRSETEKERSERVKKKLKPAVSTAQSDAIRGANKPSKYTATWSIKEALCHSDVMWCLSLFHSLSLYLCILVTHFFFSLSLSRPLGWCIALFILLRFFSRLLQHQKQKYIYK